MHKQRRIILNDDGARPYFVRNLETQEPFTPEEFAKVAVEPYLGKSIDPLLWAMGDGNVFTTQMQSAEVFGGDSTRDVNDIIDELFAEDRRYCLGQAQEPDRGGRMAQQREEARRFALAAYE